MAMPPKPLSPLHAASLVASPGQHRQMVPPPGAQVAQVPVATNLFRSAPVVPHAAPMTHTVVLTRQGLGPQEMRRPEPPGQPQAQRSGGSMRFSAGPVTEPPSPLMVVMPPGAPGQTGPGGPPTPTGTLNGLQPHRDGLHREPQTPRGVSLELPAGDDVATSGEVAALRSEVEALQLQLKSVFDMLQDQSHSLAMEAQERCELAKLLQTEREERAQDVEELRRALETERWARARDRQEIAEALRAEVDARTSDVRELARSLQSECNARAGEVEQLAKVFQSERENRIQESEDLAETLRSEFTSENGQLMLTGDAQTAQQAETTAMLIKRINDLTHLVMAERESHTRIEERRLREQNGEGAATAAVR